MSNFLTLLANTALAQAGLGSPAFVQPRLASRFEAAATDEVNDTEVIMNPTPSQLRTLPLKILPPEGRIPPALHHQEEREATESPQPRDNLSREPITEHLVELETNRDVITPSIPSLPSLDSLPHLQSWVQNLPFTQAPVTKQFQLTQPQSPPVMHELREKENLGEVHTRHHTQTRLEAVTREKLLPVIQREMVNLELPDTPLLQPVTPPTLLKPEVKAMQPQTPTVQVTIGRLEIRATPQQKTVQQLNKPTGVMSLEEYRRKRGLE
ncbi:MAG: hypothetical protein ACRCYY_19830 [Trueperaceae bacterium]